MEGEEQGVGICGIESKWVSCMRFYKSIPYGMAWHGMRFYKLRLRSRVCFLILTR